MPVCHNWGRSVKHLYSIKGQQLWVLSTWDIPSQVIFHGIHASGILHQKLIARLDLINEIFTYTFLNIKNGYMNI